MTHKLEKFDIANYDGCFMAELTDPVTSRKMALNGAWVGENELVSRGMQHIRYLPDNAVLMMVPQTRMRTYFHEIHLDLDRFEIENMRVTRLTSGLKRDKLIGLGSQEVRAGMTVFARAGFIERNEIVEGTLFRCNLFHGFDYTYYSPNWN